MKKMNLNGLFLNYIDENPEANQSIVFVHGNSHSSQSFSRQLKAPELANHYRLISVDLPGHGESSRLSTYSLSLYGNILKDFIQALGLQDVVLVGHSMGGHVAINALPFLNPRGLVLMGCPPLRKPFDPTSFLPNPHAAALFASKSAPEEVEALMDEWCYYGSEREKAVADYLRTDPQVRVDILADVVNNNHWDETELLANYGGDVLFVLPSLDTLINNKYIEDLDLQGFVHRIEAHHSAQVTESFIFNEGLQKFCQKIFDTNKYASGCFGLESREEHVSGI